MTIRFADDTPPDILIEQAVDQAMANGCRVPRWGWPMPAPYNGATGRERVMAWQKVRIAEDMGLLGARHQCGLCRGANAPQWHTEIYFRPLTSRPICRSCHLHIHLRFKRPDAWRARVRQAVHAEAWIGRLLTVEVTRDEAMHIAAQSDVWVALKQ